VADGVHVALAEGLAAPLITTGDSLNLVATTKAIELVA
jgi:hypothetical protein